MGYCMSKKTVMIIGAGQVGKAAAIYLSLNPSISKIAVVDKDSSSAYVAAINARVGASYFGFSPEVVDVQLDLNDREKAIETIREIQPEVVLHSSSTIPSSFCNPLIQRKMKEIEFQNYCPAHNLAKDFFPLYKLMDAAKKSGLRIKVVNVSTPDNTHPALAKIGLSPTVGAGNMDIVAEGMRKIISDKLNIPLQKISMILIGHYALYYWMPPQKIPYWFGKKMSKFLPFYMRIKANGKDLTKKFNGENLIRSANDMAFSSPGYHTQMAAASAVRQILSIVNDEGKIVNGSGVSGIPGSVPTRLDAGGAEIALPKDITLGEVMKINEAGMKWSGIEKIELDGTVVFTEEAVELLEIALDIHRKKIKISELGETSKELLFAYTALSEKYK